MSLHHCSTFYLSCVSAANTSPEINNLLYSVCEDTPIGIYIYMCVCEILNADLILLLWHYTSTNGIHIYTCSIDVVSTGAVAFTISATDAENDPLTYSLTGPNAGYFTVDGNTGRVSVFRQLDREVWCGGSRDCYILIYILCVCVLSISQISLSIFLFF